MEIMLLIGLCALLIWVGFRYKQFRDDDILQTRMEHALSRARASLTSEDLSSLTAQLQELRVAMLAAIRQGTKPSDASRMSKAAAIQTIEGYIEIGKMFGNK